MLTTTCRLHLHLSSLAAQGVDAFEMLNQQLGHEKQKQAGISYKEATEGKVNL